jgi:hypothetical protein
VSSQAYKWIKEAYSSHSKTIQNIKDQINKETAHANVINSQHNLLYVPSERAEIHTSYFDFENDELAKIDLWQCAKALDLSPLP